MVLSILSSMNLTGRPTARAGTAASTGTLWTNILLPKLPPASVGTMLSLWGGTRSVLAIIQPQ